MQNNFSLHRNSSGSTPLHLAAGTGHAAVVAYLLKQRGGQVVKAALDDEGKSPLAVCLDCKSNNWKKTAQILRDAYSSTVSVLNSILKGPWHMYINSLLV